MPCAGDTERCVRINADLHATVGEPASVPSRQVLPFAGLLTLSLYACRSRGRSTPGASAAGAQPSVSKLEKVAEVGTMLFPVWVRLQW